jgi:surfeit locus 1 family protein
MTFRPYPVLTAIAIPVLAALVGLGFWQLDRAQWKAGLIADFERASAEPPAALTKAFCGGADPLGQVVSDPGAAGLQLRVFGHNAAGDPGWRLFQAAKPSCAGPSAAVLSETGFEPLSMGEGIEPSAPASSGPTDRFIVEEWPSRQLMAAGNAPGRNEWHWFDARAMAAFLGAGAIDDRYILARLEGMPDYLVRTPPSGHIGYAVTWFGMAIGFVVIYALFHARAGRLRIGRQDPPRP